MTQGSGPDLARVGDRLRSARTTSGLTQDQAAAKIGIARTTLVAVENGERPVRPEELVALSELYRVSANVLMRGSAVHAELSTQFRRTRSSAKYAEMSQAAIRTLNRLAAGYVELEQRLGAPLVTDYPPERTVGRSRLDAQAEDLAQEFRARLGIGTSPIADLVSLLELELGIRIFVHALDSNISGVYGFHEQLGACILINSKHPIGRQLWTLAHDLAHFLTRRRVTAVLLVEDEGGPKDPAEVFADLFAGALLMPGSALRRVFEEYSHSGSGFTTRHLILLARRFHVSLEASARRLEHLGLLKRGTYEVLREQGLNSETVQSVIGVEEHLSLRPLPVRLTLLAASAHSKGLLTERQLAELLGLGVVEVRTMLDDLGPEFPLREWEA